VDNKSKLRAGITLAMATARFRVWPECRPLRYITTNTNEYHTNNLHTIWLLHNEDEAESDANYPTHRTQSFCKKESTVWIISMLQRICCWWLRLREERILFLEQMKAIQETAAIQKMPRAERTLRTTKCVFRILRKIQK
jgi:hypothetical protein